MTRLHFSVLPWLLVSGVIAAFAIEPSKPRAIESKGGESSSFLLTRNDTDKPKKWWRTSIRWKGSEYSIDEGIVLLMDVVRHPETGSHPWNAETALTELASIGGFLRGRTCMEELVVLYDSASVAEKRAILTCFNTSSDPLGIRVFSRALDTEKQIDLRLVAARGLAAWNVRQGIAALIELLESTEFVQHLAGTPIVGQNALQAFRTFNEHKKWGFPQDEWWLRINGRSELDEDQKRILYASEIEKERVAIMKWWAENEHRFPDWKPGNPLPEIAYVGEGEAEPHADDR